jgi:nucleoside-diphosphate-sugar epimerase
MRILVTGASGFLGRHIIRGLLADGHKVFGLSKRIDPSLGIDFMPADITDKKAVFEAVKRARAELCIHLAAAAHADVRKDKESIVRAVNVDGALNTADALLAAGTKKLIYFSTAKVLADTTPPDGIDEDCAPMPTGVYACSKHETEKALVCRAERGEMAVAIVRPVAVLGADDTKGNYAKMKRAVARGFFPLANNGQARRSIVFAHTVTKRICIMANKGIISGHSYVFEDGAWSVREIVESMRGISGRAFCPGIEIDRWKSSLSTADKLLSRIAHGRTPVENMLKRLTSSFVIHSHRWSEDYGALSPLDLGEAMRRTYRAFPKDGTWLK